MIGATALQGDALRHQLHSHGQAGLAGAGTNALRAHEADQPRLLRRSMQALAAACDDEPGRTIRSRDPTRSTATKPSSRDRYRRRTPWNPGGRGRARLRGSRRWSRDDGHLTDAEFAKAKGHCSDE